MPKLLDRSRLTKSGIPPWSIINWHCLVVPEATFARARVAYNWSWGYFYCLIYSIIIETKPALITAWMMETPSDKGRSLRMPIIPWCWFKMLLPSLMYAIRSASWSIEYFVSKNLSINLITARFPCDTSDRRWVVYLLKEQSLSYFFLILIITKADFSLFNRSNFPNSQNNFCCKFYLI